MKKTLAIILSVIMLFGVVPFASFAAEPVYDRLAVAADDEEYIADMTAEQMATVILDWVDREIAKYSEDIAADIKAGVIASGGFDQFEAFLDDAAVEAIVAEKMPEITSLDAVIGYKGYLEQLGGDFANLKPESLKTRTEAGSSLAFIDGVLQFMADNSEYFGKVFRWDEEVFDYGKVGEYIENLDTTTDENNKKIVEFYNDYLVGNDIQSKFTNWVGGQLGYTEAEVAAKDFDSVINDGILNWFAGLCYTNDGVDNDILTENAYNELLTYNLKTTDIYTLVENFVALVQSDNQVKINTYYNYIMDTVVRTLIKTMLGQKAVVGAEATLPDSFAATYADLALLEEISGGTAYYYDGTNYYQVAISGGVATANALTWEAGFEMNLEPIYAAVTTGANRKTAVKTYEPKSADIAISTYASQKNQDLVVDAGLEFTGTEVPAEIDTLMDGTATTLTDGFLLKVTQGTETISSLDISFEALETQVKNLALTTAQTSVKSYLTKQGLAEDAITVKDVSFNIIYNAWTTDDKFVCAVDAEDITVTLDGTVDAFALSVAQAAANAAVSTAAGNLYDTPIATIVVDGLAGGGADYFGQAEALLDFVNDDFVIDADLLDFEANVENGRYDTYNGVVGQANRILVDLVKMFVTEDLGLVEGGNENLTANIKTLCDKVNSMMVAANDLINNEELQGMIATLGFDTESLMAGLDLDLLYAIDFSSVEGLWTSVIGLGLDMVDDGSNATLAEIHTAVDGLTNLDAMAVAMADYVLGKCIPELNTALADKGIDFALTVPTATDAKTVEDGQGKDIIMTKLVDVLYEAAEEGVALVNSIVNKAIGHVEGETNVDLPTVAFELGVTKGTTWEATLTALTDRVYALADGIIIACDNDYTDTIDRISAVANAILPLGSLASNCASDNFAFDGNLVMGYLFDDGLDGNLDGFLRLFETKTKTADVAADCSVTEALINASEHIVDSIFPDTVNAEDYVNLKDYSTVSFTEETVQEYFTSAENDAVIASNNMDSINDRKADLVPAALNLVREAGILPFFAKCDQDHNSADLATTLEKGTAATCTEAGVEDTVKCAECGFVVSGGGTIAAKGHSWGDWTVSKNATCTVKGTETRSCGACGITDSRETAVIPHSYSATVTAATCTAQGYTTHTCSCGASYKDTYVNALGHVDSDTNYACDRCNAELEKPAEDTSFFGKIKAFFQRIIDWFKNLFKF